jgi:hypothetical protein
MTIKPLIIIGAGRSGTNILRDTLTKLHGFETWDCDEINLIWRHGNIHKPNDVFTADDANTEVKRYLHRQFDKFKAASNASVIVEKTCANSMRVPFIDAVFPDARYVYIVRDGRDVALSAAKRWTASVEFSYLAKKLRYVPLGDVPTYGIRFIKNRLHQMRSEEKRQAAWGPVFPEMREWVNTRSLLEVCAKQWATCVDMSDHAFANMSDQKVHKVSYESLVTDPSKYLTQMAEWYQPGLSQKFDANAFEDIHAGSINTWKRKPEALNESVMALLKPTLERHGYETAA